MPTSRPRKGQPGIKPTAQELAATREKQRQAVELALAGLSLEQIAQQIGYADKSGVSRAIHAALDRQEASAVEELRDLENARLDRLQTVLWPAALRGDLKAIDRVLRLFERRARLNGYDAPTKQMVHVLTEDVVDAALREAAEEHARLTADPARSTS